MGAQPPLRAKGTLTHLGTRKPEQGRTWDLAFIIRVVGVVAAGSDTRGEGFVVGGLETGLLHSHESQATGEM